MDHGSQPSRAVLSLCMLNSVPVEVKEVSIMSRDHLEPEYVKINPLKKVPVLQEIDGKSGKVFLTLTESHTIMKYIATSRGLPEHWYPR